MISDVLKHDLNYICFFSNFDFRILNGKRILVTGATGLIGFNLVAAILNYGKTSDNAPEVIALVRNISKAENMFGGFDNRYLTLIECDITEPVQVLSEVDYIIHGASQTSSKSFINEPVETIRTALKGTINMLELARTKNVDGFVYLSSMEVYGSPHTDEKIDELHNTNLNTMAVRTSYPEGKRMCESLCTSYNVEYGVPTKVIRLTQTFGPGVTYNDDRVFAEFARCAIEKKNIVLHTKGETKRSYLYTADAVTAILTVLCKGKIGEAYNAANDDTYCTIYEMAELVVRHCADEKIDIVVRIEDENSFGFAPILKMNLNTNKLQQLGWVPSISLVDMFKRLCDSLK